MVGCDFPVSLATGHGCVARDIVNCVRIVVRLLDTVGYRFALDLNVFVVNFAEKRVSRRTNIENAKGHTGLADCVRVCVCIHQFAGSESSTEDDHLLCSHVYGEYAVGVFVVGRCVAGQAGRMVFDTDAGIVFVCDRNGFYAAVLSVSFFLTVY